MEIRHATNYAMLVTFKKRPEGVEPTQTASKADALPLCKGRCLRDTIDEAVETVDRSLVYTGGGTRTPKPHSNAS